MFDLSKKEVDCYEWVCRKCWKRRECCGCYPLAERPTDNSECHSFYNKQIHKVEYFRTPSLFGEAVERRRYKTTKFIEEGELASYQAIASYYQFVAKELASMKGA